MRVQSAHPIAIVGKLLVHGLLLMFLAPIIGWLPWLLTLVAIVVLHSTVDLYRRFLPHNVQRSFVVAYKAAISLPVFAAWLFILFYQPGLWLGIGLFGAWLGFIFWQKLDPLAVMIGVAVVIPAVLIPTLSKFTSLVVMCYFTAVGVSLLLLVAFGDYTKRIGRYLFFLFFMLAMTMGANDVFYHGVDHQALQSAKLDGVAPILIPVEAPDQLRATMGLEFRFIERDPYGRLLIGSEAGVFLVSPNEIRKLPVGPAGDNAGVDYANRNLYLATRDGKLSLLTGEALAVNAQTDLPHGALVTRVAVEGVFALDEVNWVARYNKQSLGLQKKWTKWHTFISDLLPDGQGGFFLTTLGGSIIHQNANGPQVRSKVNRLGLFHLMAVDRERERIFVGNMAGSSIHILRTNNLELRGKIDTDRGIRNLYWDDKTETLLAGNYFTGELIAYRGRPLQEVGRIYLGKRMRSIASDSPGFVLIASGGGLFSLDITAAFHLSFPELQ